MAFRIMAMYSLMRVRGLRNSSPWKSSMTSLPLAPSPRKKRPSVMTSMLRAVMARLEGERAYMGTMLVPILMREVTAPSWAREVRESSAQDSPMVMQL